eukprot:Platyproteum_vivax@DN4154_c0_g1_i1.p1
MSNKDLLHDEKGFESRKKVGYEALVHGGTASINLAKAVSGYAWFQVLTVFASMALLIITSNFYNEVQRLHLDPRLPFQLEFLKHMKTPPVLATAIIVFGWDILEAACSVWLAVFTQTHGTYFGNVHRKQLVASKDASLAHMRFLIRLTIRGLALTLFVYFISMCQTELQELYDKSSFSPHVVNRPTLLTLASNATGLLLFSVALLIIQLIVDYTFYYATGIEVGKWKRYTPQV